MAWIEVHQSLPTHEKTWAAADALGIAPVYMVGHLVAFWLWAIDNAPDGELKASPRLVARAAQWEGDPEAFAAALLEAGYLDQDRDVYRIHDWADYAGRLIDQREKNRERQRRFRNNHKPATRPVTDDTRNEHVTVMSPLRNGATVPDHTVPNRTDPPTPQTPRETQRHPATATTKTYQAEETFEQYNARMEHEHPEWTAYVAEMSKGAKKPAPYRAKIYRELEAGRQTIPPPTPPQESPPGPAPRGREIKLPPTWNPETAAPSVPLTPGARQGPPPPLRIARPAPEPQAVAI